MKFQDLPWESQEERVDEIVRAHIERIKEFITRDEIEKGMPLYRGVARAHLEAGDTALS